MAETIATEGPFTVAQASSDDVPPTAVAVYYDGSYIESGEIDMLLDEAREGGVSQHVTVRNHRRMIPLLPSSHLRWKRRTVLEKAQAELSDVPEKIYEFTDDV